MSYKLKKVFKIYELNHVKGQIVLKEPTELDYGNDVTIFSSYDTEEEAIEELNKKLSDLISADIIIQPVYEICYFS